MADNFIPPFDDEEVLNNAPAAKKSAEDVDEVSMSKSFAALMARFGEAEEDEKIREEGFELAQKGGLIRKPRPEDKMGYYMSGTVDKRDEIRTDADSRLSKVFDSAKSEHDSDGVDFSDLKINDAPKPAEPEAPKKKEEPAAEKAEEAPAEPPKRKRGRPRKNPLPEEAPAEEKKTEKKTEKKAEEKEPPKAENIVIPAISIADADENETVEMVRKYNTHTKVIFVDDSIDDGIKRNSDEELNSLFNNEKGRKRSWLRRKK